MLYFPLTPVRRAPFAKLADEARRESRAANSPTVAVSSLDPGSARRTAACRSAPCSQAGGVVDDERQWHPSARVEHRYRGILLGAGQAEPPPGAHSRRGARIRVPPARSRRGLRKKPRRPDEWGEKLVISDFVNCLEPPWASRRSIGEQLPDTARLVSDPVPAYDRVRRRATPRPHRTPEDAAPMQAASYQEPADRLERILAGEESAFAEAFADHRERLWRMVHFRLDRRLQGRVDADDILQEAYLDAVGLGLPHFAESQPMSLFVWLRLVVGQTLIDVHRRHLGAKMRDAEREESIQQRLSEGTSISLSFHLLAPPHVAQSSRSASGAVQLG